MLFACQKRAVGTDRDTDIFECQIVEVPRCPGNSDVRTNTNKHGLYLTLCCLLVLIFAGGNISRPSLRQLEIWIIHVSRLVGALGFPCKDAMLKPPPQWRRSSARAGGRAPNRQLELLGPSAPYTWVSSSQLFKYIISLHFCSYKPLLKHVFAQVRDASLGACPACVENRCVRASPCRRAALHPKLGCYL